ncbi:MAG: STAS domain-containing protein [Spirochaetia bacterium]
MQYGIDFLRDTSRTEEDQYETTILKISIKGRLNISNAGEVGLLLETLINGGLRKILVNMEELDYIDSTGIGTLVRLAKLIRSKNGEFCLLNVPPSINKVLKIVRLETFINQFLSEQKAVDFLYNE